MRYIWIFSLLLAAGSAVAAEVYRSVDADGNVIYSDRPAGQDVETVFIDTATATPIEAEEDDAESEQQGLFIETESVETEDAGPTAEELAAQRVENCAIARDRNERYLIAHRIYRGTEDNREYLTDVELDEIRAEAAADVEEWCD